ncbi:MAG TPA: tetratricopeptide repeat protein, partial [Ktedonobacterales bacterium]|nr:tetratricopeptide repeat protein [Ktedonobacterales bacterium]
VLFIDDAQWADNASLELLLYLARRLHGHRIYLLVTWRTSDASANHHLRQLAIETQRMGRAVHLTLGRLDVATVARLADAALPRNTPSPEIVRHLYAETEGVPFFVVEYLAALAKGQLRPEYETWSLPGGVRDLLRSRLGAVSEVGWQILHAAAVIGRSFPFELLRLASGRSEEEVVSALEELSAQGIIIEMQRGATGATTAGGGDQELHYDFSHEKLRAVVNDEMSLARRRLLHRRIAEALVAAARSQREEVRPLGISPLAAVAPLASTVARHSMMAGDTDDAAKYFKLAGDYAASLYANAEALAHYRSALGLGYADVAALHDAIGDVLTLTGEYGAALQSYETAAAQDDDAIPSKAVPLTRIRYKMGNVYARRGDWSEAQEHLEAALAVSDMPEDGTRARILADLGLVAYHRGESDRAAEMAAQALALAESVVDTRAQAQAHNIAGMLASRQGDMPTALHHLEQSLVLAEGLHDPGARIAALNNLALAHAAHGDPQRGVALIEAALALCVSQGDRHREAALHNNLADLLHVQGRSEASLEHIKQSVAIYAEIGVVAGEVQPEIWKLAEW